MSGVRWSSIAFSLLSISASQVESFLQQKHTTSILGQEHSNVPAVRLKLCRHYRRLAWAGVCMGSWSALGCAMLRTLSAMLDGSRESTVLGTRNASADATWLMPPAPFGMLQHMCTITEEETAALSISTGRQTEAGGACAKDRAEREVWAERPPRLLPPIPPALPPVSSFA